MVFLGDFFEPNFLGPPGPPPPPGGWGVYLRPPTGWVPVEPPRVLKRSLIIPPQPSVFCWACLYLHLAEAHTPGWGILRSPIPPPSWPPRPPGVPGAPAPGIQREVLEPVQYRPVDDQSPDQPPTHPAAVGVPAVGFFHPQPVSHPLVSVHSDFDAHNRQRRSQRFLMVQSQHFLSLCPSPYTTAARPHEQWRTTETLFFHVKKLGENRDTQTPVWWTHARWMPPRTSALQNERHNRETATAIKNYMREPLPLDAPRTSRPTSCGRA